jgi:hypothetical protein
MPALHFDVASYHSRIMARLSKFTSTLECLQWHRRNPAKFMKKMRLASSLGEILNHFSPDVFFSLVSIPVTISILFIGSQKKPRLKFTFLVDEFIMVKLEPYYRCLLYSWEKFLFLQRH